jgi:hypothetical protein
MPESSRMFYEKLHECRTVLYTAGMTTQAVNEAIKQRIERQKLYEERLYEDAKKSDPD